MDAEKQSEAEVLALDAERRAEAAADQDERDGWLRLADWWWGQVKS